MDLYLLNNDKFEEIKGSPFQLEKDVSKLQKKLSSTKQFNHKVEINTQLHEKVARIQKLKFNSIINLRETELDS
jgi:hypothetical protein